MMGKLINIFNVLAFMELFNRITYTLHMLRRYHVELMTVYNSRIRNLRVSHLSPAVLKQQGVEVLVLDFDGVLAAQGESKPADDLHDWLKLCVNTFGATQIFVLSNNALASRIQYFQNHFAGIQYIVGSKKKPYPDGLQEIISLTNQPAKSLMLVDDRLLTGILAACISNVPVTYITKPYVNFSKRPVEELFFTSLRVLERYLVQISAFMSKK
jgi:predicted HAD superfamily phosphohydrolase YqeG